MKTDMLRWPLFVNSKAKREAARNRAVGWCFLATMIMASSMNPSLAKQLTTAFAPLSLLFLAELLIGSFNVLSFGFVPMVKGVMELKKEKLIPLFCMTTITGVIGPLLWFTGLHNTTAINGELFGRTEILFFLIFSVTVLHEKLRRIHLFAAGIILFGIITVGMRGFQNGIEVHAGDMIILTAALMYSCSGVIVKKYLHDIHPELLIFSRSATAIAAFFLISPFVDHTLMEEIRAFPPELLWPLIAYGFAARFFGIFSYYQAIERLPVSRVSMFATVSVVGSVLFAHFYLGEALYWYHGVGAALILCGATLMKLDGLWKTDKHLLRHMKVHHRNEM